MMRYLLFAGHNYYPKGGFDDLVAQADTVEQLQKYFVDHAEYIANGSYIDNWGQIVEYATMTLRLEGSLKRSTKDYDLPLAADWRDLYANTI